MATLREIRQALHDTLIANIPAINVYRRVPGSIVPPAVVIFPRDIDYLSTFRNSTTPWEFDLIVAAGTDDEFAQDPLDELIDARGDRSIPQVLLNNQRLGRTDCSIKAPLAMSGYGGRVTFGETQYVAATIRVGVITTHE